MGDSFDITQQIVAAACGPLSDGTIEDEERRMVAAEIAQWVLEENEGGVPPEPEEIVRETIATIIFEVAATETAARWREGDRPPAATVEAERQIRAAAEVLAGQAELNPSGPTPAEFEAAIENGLDVLRSMWEAE